MPCQGRPLGYLAAWLLQDKNLMHRIYRENHIYEPHAQPPRVDRVMARNMLKDIEGIENLFECERPRRDGEPEEPEGDYFF